MKKGAIATIATVVGGVAGSALTLSLQNKRAEQKEQKVDKFKGYYNMLNQWLMLKQEGKSLEEYFVQNGYKTAAIYGMGELGNRLYEELKNTSIEIKYAVDVNAAATYSELEVFEIDDSLETVDVMVVTAIFAFEEIEKMMRDKVDFPIVSLEDVVYEI